MAAKKGKGNVTKSSVKRRTANGPAATPGGGAPANEQDVKRRLGNFTGAGEHSRVGGRTTGIVGQKKSAFRTDNKLNNQTKSKGTKSGKISEKE